MVGGDRDVADMVGPVEAALGHDREHHRVAPRPLVKELPYFSPSSASGASSGSGAGTGPIFTRPSATRRNHFDFGIAQVAVIVDGGG